VQPPQQRGDHLLLLTWKHLSKLSIVTRASAVSGDMLSSCRMPVALISTSRCCVSAATYMAEMSAVWLAGQGTVDVASEQLGSQPGHPGARQ